MAGSVLPGNHYRGLKPQEIAPSPKTKHLPAAHRRNQRFPPERFTRVNVRQMDFNGRYPACRDRVPQSNACMCVTRWIENNYVESTPRLLDQIHQNTLGIRLRKFHFRPAFGSTLPHLGFYFPQAKPSVNFRFTAPQQIQIRSIQEQYLHKSCTPCSHPDQQADRGLMIARIKAAVRIVKAISQVADLKNRDCLTRRLLERT